MATYMGAGPGDTGSSERLRGVIRHVLSEEANRHRAGAVASAGPPAHSASEQPMPSATRSGAHSGAAAGMAPAMDERARMLHDRVAVLEDVLIKSEADRAAVYERCDAATRALAAAHEERTALIHSLHEAGAQHANAMELEAAQREVIALRDHVDRLCAERDVAARRAEEAEATAKQLKKEKRRMLAETDGVSLADLHYSNERLSAQLTQLQREKQQQDGAARSADAARVLELDMAVRTLTNELAAVEQRVSQAQSAQDEERRRLQDQLDRQFRDFSVERAECDAVVSAMGSKMEAMSFRVDALLSENASLKSQLAAAQSQLMAIQGAGHVGGSPAQHHATGGRLSKRAY